MATWKDEYFNMLTTCESCKFPTDEQLKYLFNTLLAYMETLPNDLLENAKEFRASIALTPVYKDYSDVYHPVISKIIVSLKPREVSFPASKSTKATLNDLSSKLPAFVLDFKALGTNILEFCIPCTGEKNCSVTLFQGAATLGRLNSSKGIYSKGSSKLLYERLDSLDNVIVIPESFFVKE